MTAMEKDEELGIEAVPWSRDTLSESVEQLYAHDTRFARTKVRWYLDDATKSGRYAKWIRAFTIVLGTFGVMLPLVDAARPIEQSARLGPWGYVVLTLATGLFSFDRFGGLTWRWTRSTLIWVSLRRELAEFQHNWALVVSSGGAAGQLVALKTFRSNLEIIIAQECKDWGIMTNQARMELELSLQRDLVKPRDASERA